MKELVEAIKNNNIVLFIGSGISRNLGLPTWDELIDNIAYQLGYDKDIFKMYGDHLSLAEYYEIEKGSLGTLRSWMDVNWHKKSIKIEKSKIHQLIVDINFPLIYTTNYDNWIEYTFDYYKKKYNKITNVTDISKIKENLTQIIKLHGDFQDDNSIVLTESSYFKRLSFESPLDIKLRSDILGKSILFIGYSLSDINIRYLLYKLNVVWEDIINQDLRPKSYLFLSQPNPVQEKILEKRGIIPIISESENPSVGLIKFLKNVYKELNI